MEAQRIATVNPQRCLGCGQCVRVCLDKIFSIEQGVAVARNATCLGCGHCVAACPAGAVTMPHGDLWSQEFVHFTPHEDWLPHGGGDAAQLVRLMRSRRSCRNYQERPVERTLLEDLIRIGISAPSGTNSQLWSFTVFPSREAVLSLATPIKDFFGRLNATAARGWLRTMLKWVGKSDLDHYYHTYYSAVQAALDAWEHDAEDRLFHGAQAAILVGSRPGASCPAEDALLATQNILLGAHDLGLGTCLIGYAVAALQHCPRIKESVGMPRKEPVYAVIALGWPNESYVRVADRRKPSIRWVEPPA